MSIKSKEVSSVGIYHIIARGINRQTIFIDDEDRKMFLNRLEAVMQDINFEVFGYCMLDNHIHLLVKEGTSPIWRAIMVVLQKFARWYNRKYDRIGSLFQDSYKRQAIDSNEELVRALRYIHQEPLRTGIVEALGEFKWSTHNLYLHENNRGCVNTQKILELLGGTDKYAEFMKEEEITKFMEYDFRPLMSMEALKIKFEKICIEQGIIGMDISGLDRDEKYKVLRQLYFNENTSINRVARVTGVACDTVLRAIRDA